MGPLVKERVGLNNMLGSHPLRPASDCRGSRGRLESEPVPHRISLLDFPATTIACSPRKVAPDEDPPQGILLPIGYHGWADLQVAKGVQATHRTVPRFPSHIAEIWTLAGETESGRDRVPGRA